MAASAVSPSRQSRRTSRVPLRPSAGRTRSRLPCCASRSPVRLVLMLAVIHHLILMEQIPLPAILSSVTPHPASSRRGMVPVADPMYQSLMRGATTCTARSLKPTCSLPAPAASAPSPALPSTMDASSSSLRRSTKHSLNRARATQSPSGFPPDETTCNRFRFLVESENCSHAQKSSASARNRIAHPCSNYGDLLGGGEDVRMHTRCRSPGLLRQIADILLVALLSSSSSSWSRVPPLSLDAASVRHGHSALPIQRTQSFFPFDLIEVFHHFLLVWVGICCFFSCAIQSGTASCCVPAEFYPPPSSFCPLQYCQLLWSPLGSPHRTRLRPHGIAAALPNSAASRSSSAGLDHLRRALLRPDLRAPRRRSQPPQLRRPPAQSTLFTDASRRLSHRKSRPSLLTGKMSTESATTSTTACGSTTNPSPDGSRLTARKLSSAMPRTPAGAPPLSAVQPLLPSTPMPCRTVSGPTATCSMASWPGCLLRDNVYIPLEQVVREIRSPRPPTVTFAASTCAIAT